MPKNLINDFAESRVIYALDKFRRSQGLEHAGLKGMTRELFLKEFLEPFLQSDIKCGSGVTIDRHGHQSAQTDVVVYSKNALPAIEFIENAGIYPVESCFYAIEVKTTVSSAAISDACHKAETINNLHSMYNLIFGQYSAVPRAVLFAFSIDLISDSKNEFLRFKNIVDQAKPHPAGGPAIRALCVVGRGYWYYTPESKDGKIPARWHKIDSSTTNSEVLSFLGGVCNTISQTKEQRSGLSFGNYLIDGCSNTTCD